MELMEDSDTGLMLAAGSDDELGRLFRFRLESSSC